MAAYAQGTHQWETIMHLLAREEKIWQWWRKQGRLGLCQASHVQSQLEQKEMGDKVHHRGICPWGTYALLALSISESVSKIQSE